jgi:hypothetical protein
VPPMRLTARSCAYACASTLAQRTPTKMGTLGLGTVCTVGASVSVSNYDKLEALWSR